MQVNENKSAPASARPLIAPAASTYSLVINPEQSIRRWPPHCFHLSWNIFETDRFGQDTTHQSSRNSALMKSAISSTTQNTQQEDSRTFKQHPLHPARFIPSRTSPNSPSVSSNIAGARNPQAIDKPYLYYHELSLPPRKLQPSCLFSSSE